MTTVLIWSGAAGMIGLPAPPPGAAPWARINQVPGGGSLDSPSLVLGRQTVIAAVNRTPTSSPTTLEVAQFVPTVLTGASALHNAQLVPEPSPSASLDAPQLIPRSPPRLLIPDPHAGLSLWSLATPTMPVTGPAFWTPYSRGR